MVAPSAWGTNLGKLADGAPLASTDQLQSQPCWFGGNSSVRTPTPAGAWRKVIIVLTSVSAPYERPQRAQPRPRDLAAGHLVVTASRMRTRASLAFGGAPAADSSSHLAASTISRGTPKPLS